MEDLRDTNITIIWGCGHRKAFRAKEEWPFCVQASAYPCAERCNGWTWGDGPGEIHLVFPETLEEYIDMALTGTDEDRTQYPPNFPSRKTEALSCWLS